MTTIQNTNLLAQRLNNEQNKKLTVSMANQPIVNTPQNTQKQPPWNLLLLSMGLIFANIPLFHLINTKLMKSDKELGINFDSVKKVFDKMFAENKLAEKGVTSCFVLTGSEEAKNLIKTAGGGAYIFDLKKGIKQIATVRETASVSLHEAGHAINHNCTKLGKFYSKVIDKMPSFLQNPLMLATVAVVVLQYIGNAYNKPKAGKKENQKEPFSITKFVHDNIGKLSVLAFAPCLLDEGFATKRALSATKKLAPEMLKPLRKNLFTAALTYLLSANAMLISSLLNRKFVDEVKAQQNSQNQK
ncbi:MAG: hypothetical protein WCG95_02325 [bacterium]